MKYIQSLLVAALLGIMTISAAISQTDDTKFNIIDVQGNLVVAEISQNTLALYIRGKITSAMVGNFLNITRNRDIKSVILDSLGGDLEAGITLAEIVSLRKMDTFVGEGASCASACSLIFFAGENRILLGRVGVHQYRSVQGAGDTESQAQARVGRLVELLNSFGAPQMAIEKMAITRSDCMYWFDNRHSDLVVRTTASLDAPRIEGTLECFEPSEARPQVTSPSTDTPTAPDEKGLRELRRSIQAELNRVGCTLGTPDGIIGPRSRRALNQFLTHQSGDAAIASFDNPVFLTALQTIANRVCPVPPRPVVADLSGNWILSGKCSFSSTPIKGQFLAKKTSPNRYSMFYQNNIGETGTGVIVQNGKRASVSIRWNAGNRTTSNMTINSHGNRMTGRSSNGCTFTAWR